MKELLEAKYKQCEVFRNTLLSTEDDILVEATRDLKWACGLDPDTAKITDPHYWPGQNLLGAMLMDMRDHHNSLDEDCCEDLPSTQTCRSRSPQRRPIAAGKYGNIRGKKQ